MKAPRVRPRVWILVVVAFGLIAGRVVVHKIAPSITVIAPDRCDVRVTVDDKELGTVSANHRETFKVARGKHHVQLAPQYPPHVMGEFPSYFDVDVADHSVLTLEGEVAK